MLSKRIDWSDFKEMFKQYIRNTVGLFTLLENTSFVYFDLDRFLDSQANTINRPRSVTQIEMLMSLATFIHIVESDENTVLEPISHRVLLNLKALIAGDLLKLSPYSRLKKQCLSFMEQVIHHSIECVAAPAA
jgi:hypothetical protein